MKRTLFFIACMLASITMLAQEDSIDYLPFVELGKEWHVVSNPTHPYVPCTYERFEMTEEVERDGKTYVLTYRTNVEQGTSEEVGLFREEDRRVYKYAGDRDVMMYDFSLKEGDTFTYEIILGSPETCKVLKQGWLEDGPQIEMPDSLHADGTRTFKYRKLRTWTIGRDNSSGGYNEIATWVECIGALENMFLPFSVGWIRSLAYIFRKEHYGDNEYLPFPLYNMYGPVYGCDLPTGEEDFSEDRHHQLSYELEGDRLHVFGKVFTQCGPNNYAFFYEKPTDDSLVRKIAFEIREVEPLADCVALHATDFYVFGFIPTFNYIVVDNNGEEHPVINKTYRPFVEEGKVWKVGSCDSGNPVQLVDYYYFDGDTIVGGKTCKQMKRQGYVNPDYAETYEISQDHIYVGAWYEEEKKVYAYDSTNKQFKMMYDFSIDVNDTLQINNFSYVIGPRMTGGIKGFKGVYRDVWECEGDEERIYFQCAPWLEGVGVVYGPPTTNIFNVESADPAWLLMACTVGDEVIYLNDEYEDGATPDAAEARKNRFDFTHTTKKKPKTRSKQEKSDACISSSERDVARPKVKTRNGSEDEQVLYGEYNEKQLSIDLNPIVDAYLVSITDESGKTVYEKAINAGRIVGLNIDISAYSEGQYTVTVENSNESFVGVFNAQTTGMKEVRMKKEETRSLIYNLQGQRLSSLQKGLNIVNGKKVYVK